jgi:hypothetical protein
MFPEQFTTALGSRKQASSRPALMNLLKNEVVMKNIDGVDVLNMVLFVGGLLAFVAGHLAAKGTREIQRQTEELRKNNAERVSQLKEL